MQDKHCVHVQVELPNNAARDVLVNTAIARNVWVHTPTSKLCVWLSSKVLTVFALAC